MVPQTPPHIIGLGPWEGMQEWPAGSYAVPVFVTNLPAAACSATTPSNSAMPLMMPIVQQQMQREGPPEQPSTPIVKNTFLHIVGASDQGEYSHAGLRRQNSEPTIAIVKDYEDSPTASNDEDAALLCMKTGFDRETSTEVSTRQASSDQQSSDRDADGEVSGTYGRIGMQQVPGNVKLQMQFVMPGMAIGGPHRIGHHIKPDTGSTPDNSEIDDVPASVTADHGESARSLSTVHASRFPDECQDLTGFRQDKKWDPPADPQYHSGCGNCLSAVAYFHGNNWDPPMDSRWEQPSPAASPAMDLNPTMDPPYTGKGGMQGGASSADHHRGSNDADDRATGLQQPRGGKADRRKVADQWAGVLTVMVRQVPRHYTQWMLLKEVNGEGFEGLLDFMYLPWDFKKNINVGYGFISFTDPRITLAFRNAFDGKYLDGSMKHKGKPLRIHPASVQGYDANWQHFMRTKTGQNQDARFSPLFLPPSVRAAQASQAAAAMQLSENMGLNQGQQGHQGHLAQQGHQVHQGHPGYHSHQGYQGHNGHQGHHQGHPAPHAHQDQQQIHPRAAGHYRAQKGGGSPAVSGGGKGGHGFGNGFGAPAAGVQYQVRYMQQGAPVHPDGMRYVPAMGSFDDNF